MFYDWQNFMIFVSAQFDASAQIFFRAWWWTSQGFDWVSCLPVSRDGCASFLFIFKRLPKQDFARQDIWSSFLNLRLEKETICFLNLHLEKGTICFFNLHLEKGTICFLNLHMEKRTTCFLIYIWKTGQFVRQISTSCPTGQHAITRNVVNVLSKGICWGI